MSIVSLICSIVLFIIVIYLSKKVANLESENTRLRLKACNIIDSKSESIIKLLNSHDYWRDRYFELLNRKRVDPNKDFLIYFKDGDHTAYVETNYTPQPGDIKICDHAFMRPRWRDQEANKKDFIHDN